MQLCWSNIKVLADFYAEVWELCTTLEQSSTLHNMMMQGRMFHA